MGNDNRYCMVIDNWQEKGLILQGVMGQLSK